MKEYEIEIEYVVSVPVKYGYTDTGGTFIKTLSHVDHPSFDQLRTHLGAAGMIKIERGWWNGDRVLEDFTLNGLLFEKGDKFVCAGAMGYHLKQSRNNYGRKRNQTKERPS